ncbi:MAG: DUF2202 domain-containing protein [Kiloniellales bacterium]
MPDCATIAALKEALEDEYKARATYRKVIERFGPVRPFINIVEAEDRHAKALLRLLERRGSPPSPDRWPERVSAPGSLREACAAAIEAEIENAAMYDRLLRAIDDPEALGVMRRLQYASQHHHLPAFRRCLENKGGGNGRGRRRRSGWGS